MRIAVVDDCAADRAWLAEALERLLARQGPEGAVEAFGSGEAFLAAEALRRFDPDCLLVFSTSSRDHALEGYRVQAVQYLVKPYGAEALEALFRQLRRLLPAPEKYLELRTGRQAIRVRLSSLLWAEHFQHQVRLHTLRDGVLASRLTFREFTDGTRVPVSRDLARAARSAFGDWLFRAGRGEAP